MPKSHQKKNLAYNAVDLFDIVIDIEKYSDFIPWCSKSKIISKKRNKIIADLVISYKFINETFRSYVDYDKKKLSIYINYTEGPLKSLITSWKFNKITNKKTEVIFDIEIKFKFWVFNNLLKKFFSQIEKKMINAFEKRAKEILSKNS
ncbi:MAG: Ribosome association toxin RatA [Alphaproteobacteria bacterium MarineAlpha5_Bin12]|mgnify:FL=1|nr:MAG: Ribosome association toxin RatA [Alphaproteobacteria bacterium MarineAlpha5_Bin12]|tara:strand:- start:36351 stop:36794 length:444 start_codon:yes stop_codon:yes gene_type:complete